jgi:hypothetical protein
MSLSVSHVWLEMKQPEEICGRRCGDFIVPNVEQASQNLSRLDHQRWLIALATMKGRRKPGCVGFNEEPFQRNAPGNVAERLRLGISKITGKRDQETKIEGMSRLLPAAAEAVHDAAKTSPPPMFLQNREKIDPRVGGLVRATAMDQDGPLARRRNFELANETSPLYVSWSALVIVVEADFPACDDFRLGQKSVEFRESGVICFGCAVRIDSRACVELGKFGACLPSSIELAAKVERLVHFCRPLANTDGEDNANAGLTRSTKHRLTIICVARAVQVCVRVNQQRSLIDYMEDSA